MLTDKQIAEALDLIDGRYHDVITKYLQKVGKTINEIGHLNQSSINLLVQLRRMGVDVQTIERELQKVTKLTKRDIKALFRKAAQEANTDARFSYVSKGVEPDSVRWEALVENIWKQTAGAMDNLSNNTVITDGYRSAIDDAVQAVTMGASDYNSTIRAAVRRIGREGLQVEYESTYIAADGQLKHRRRRLDSAVRQNVLDGIRQVQQKAQELIGEEIGADGVDITAHPNSAPDHEPVQGRRFDLENFQRMQSGLDFEDVDGNSYKGFERPITQWRCRHLIFYILLGVTRRMYTDEQLDAWQQENQKGCVIDGKHYTNYEATQLMRDIETEIRKQKDTAVLAKASGDDVLRRECQSNINKLTKKYNSVAEAAGLRKQMQKTRVEGFMPFVEDDREAEKFFGVNGRDKLTSMVIGVLLLLSGVGIGLGLALIAAGIAGSVVAWKLSDNPITRFVKGIANTIIGFVNMIIEAINSLCHIRFNGLQIGGVQIIPKIDTRLLNIPKIPLLAQGAVIPPNREFMAILGDQKHGTNIEAPLTTIQEAVAAVMADYEAANLAGHEATVETLREILAAVLGIEVGDTTIGQAANRYNQKMAIIKGGL